MAALLATSKSAPSVPITQRTDVISALHPIVNSALHFQQIVGSAAFHLFMRTFFAATIVATVSVWASKSIAWRAFLASRHLAAATITMSKRLAWTAWDSKRSRRFRKRLEYELFVLLFGPGGQTFFLLLFWPGWLMLGILGLCVWRIAG